MRTIINEFECTQEVMERAVEAVLKHRAKSTYMLCAVAIFAVICNIVFELQKGGLQYINASTLLLVLVIMYFLLHKRIENRDREAVKGIFKDGESFTSRVELGHDISIYHDDAWEGFDWNSYRTYVKTDEFILIILKRNAFIPMRCDSFVQGTQASCIELLKSRQKKGRLM